MIVMSPGDNKVKDSQSDAKVGNFGANRKVTDNVQKSEDYTKPSLGRRSNVETEGIPAEDTTKDIDNLNDPEAKKREASRRAETNTVGAANKFRRPGDGDKIFSEPDNRPTGEGREDDGVVEPDDKKHGPYNPWHPGESDAE